MVLLSIGTTATKVVDPNPNRKEVHITNQDTADEVVRASISSADVAVSAHVAYNRETIVIRGPMAQLAIWVISDTATTAVTVSEVF